MTTVSSNVVINTLNIDESLAPFAKLQKYVGSEDAAVRSHIFHEVLDATREIGVARANEIVLLLQRGSNDSDASVRQVVLEQLQELAQLVLGENSKEGYALVTGSLQRIAVGLCSDQIPDVRYAAATAMLALARLMSNSDVIALIVPAVLALAGSQVDEHRVESTQV